MSSRLSFTAIDLETATTEATSACAVGLVRVRRGRIVERAYHLIRPPHARFDFTYLHRIDWAQVRGERTFGALWPELHSFFVDIDFVAAHNASFDARVLDACCAHYGLVRPSRPFRCTVRLARERWGLRPTTLRHVADYLGIPLDHHNAASDAEACAEIVLRASSPAGRAEPVAVPKRLARG